MLPVYLSRVRSILLGGGFVFAAELLTPVASGQTAASSDSSKAATPAQPPAPKKNEETDADALYKLGKQLFDEYAPEEIKKDYEFPSLEQWNAFAGRLQSALQGDSLQELAAYEPEARKALTALQTLPDGADYADWLTERLDLIESARDSLKPRPPVRPELPKNPAGEPKEPTAPLPRPGAHLPNYELWLRRVKDKPIPPRAGELVPRLKAIFREGGLPAELAWLAEVESSLNPSAKSPVGARGLYQLMPDTARALGLSLFPFDERAQPEKNAKAAVRLLVELHARFKSWPLALAAYNAGPGRVGRALEKNTRASFADIASSLPAETRMYVPKVFATLAVRENVVPESLAAPLKPAP
jgi:membrane-bound lytic murein transglycosylase D